jgi:xanthine permease XanP
VPEISATLPPLLKDMFSSGIATGGMCALLLNSVLPGSTTPPTCKSSR